jgi:hypothetical protein
MARLAVDEGAPIPVSKSHALPCRKNKLQRKT